MQSHVVWHKLDGHFIESLSITHFELLTDGEAFFYSRISQTFEVPRQSRGVSHWTNNWDGKIIAIIVSGYDGDGAAALCGIKEVGGITIAQKLETAVQPDMPKSAIASGCIDFILSPEDIAKEIVRIMHDTKR